MNTTPEDSVHTGRSPEAKTRENILSAIKAKINELVSGIKQKFNVHNQNKAEEYLSGESIQNYPKHKVEERQTLFNNLQSAIDGSAKSEVVDSIKHTVGEIVQQASQDAQAEKFYDIISFASDEVNENSAIPFARYLLRLANDNVSAIENVEDVLKQVRNISEIFVQEAGLGQRDLDPASDILSGLWSKYKDLILRDKEGYAAFVNEIEFFKNKGLKGYDELTYDISKEIRKKIERGEVSALKRETRSISSDNFTEKYKELESAICGADLPDGDSFASRRMLVYNLLEMDVNGISSDLREKWEKLSEQGRKSIKDLESLFDTDNPNSWAFAFSQEYEKRLNGLPEHIVSAAREYRDSFINFLKVRTKRSMRWSHNLNDADEAEHSIYMRPREYDLTNEFGNPFDNTMVAFAFFDNKTNKDIKDIFFHFKIKSFIQEQEKRNPGFIEDMVLNQNQFNLLYSDVEKNMLSDIKKLYLRLFRYTLEGNEQPSEELRIMVDQIMATLNKRNFNAAPVTFLGGLAGEALTEEGSKNVAQEVQILSHESRELYVNPQFFDGKRYIELEQRLESYQHKDTLSLMRDMNDRTQTILKIAQQAKDVLKAIAEGSKEEIARIGAIFSNDVFDNLSIESPIIQDAMTAYSQALSNLLLAGGGEIRPALFSESQEAGISALSMMFNRILRATHPEASEDELKVYSTIGRAMAWGVGDVGKKLQRALPPINITPKQARDYIAEFAPIVKEIRAQYANAPAHERNARIASVITARLAEHDKKMSPMFLDQYARAWLTSVNPYFHLFMWADMMHEYKLHELMFGGEYALDEADYESSGRKFGKSLVRFFPLPKGIKKMLPRYFPNKDPFATPHEILKMADQEKLSLYEGMTDDVFNQRLKGRAPLVLRTMSFGGNIGISERGGWRFEAFRPGPLFDKYLQTRLEQGDNGKERDKPLSKEEFREIIDWGIQLGPYAALTLHKKFLSDERFIHYVKGLDKGYVNSMHEYIILKIYELFPSSFVQRPDFIRHTRSGDKLFDSEWHKEIATDILSGGELEKFINKNFFNPTVLGSMQDEKKALASARQIQQIMREGLTMFETHIMSVRNSKPELDGNVYTLRQMLHELSELDPDQDPNEYKKHPHVAPAKKYIKYIIKTYALSDAKTERDENRLVNTMAKHLYKILYGSQDSEITPENMRDKSVSRGIVDRLRYSNYSAKEKDQRTKKVDIFTFLDTLSSSPLGSPIFDFYRENMDRFFSMQATGDKDSGKGIAKRSFGDLGTYSEGISKTNEAVNIIAKGIRAMTTEEFEAAEDEFLNKALEAAQVFESYNSENKRHEIATHLMIQWLLMARAPRSSDLRFVNTLIKGIGSITAGQKGFGKSLAEIINRGRSGLLDSKMKYDYVGLQNFIFKAQRKGLLPVDSAGESPEAQQKAVKDIIAPSLFRKIDNKLRIFERKMQGKTETDKLSFRERLYGNILKKVHNFGNTTLSNYFKYTEKHEFNSEKLKDMVGWSISKNTSQIAVYILIALAAIIGAAFVKGAEEMDLGK